MEKENIVSYIDLFKGYNPTEKETEELLALNKDIESSFGEPVGKEIF